ncbi:PepSY-associated TM helix domain-containing protein [Pedobacter metabolipauper]|uniref:Putative iron-regulated membrane protein n=1 Tax=Pedobacter metabolipauper TaxID=425513 RepID=A0A4R6T150_9SPHI|nr:PepSY-associated TM helix domain-containing protein [Pedobacter metabolipauper]TDQ11071.1 putative iron-regulated membrane protein [Pedobacter metabolipauper]
MLPLSFKKYTTLLHLWLGLISGLVVFILGITGAMYAFQEEIKDVLYKDRLYVPVPPDGKKLPLSHLITKAESALGKTRKISRVEISQKPGRTYMFRSLKVNKDGFGYWNYYAHYQKVYLNPYTGKVVFVENAAKEFFTVVLALHMNLLLGDQVGHQVARWSVVCFVLLLITGMILWWPKKWKRKQLKTNFTIKWNAKFKRLNYDLHKVFGFYAFLLLLIISLTGLMWSFDVVAEKKSKVLSDTTQVMGKSPSDLIFKQAMGSAPQTAYFLYNFPALKSGTVNVSAYLSEDHLYDRIQFKYDRYNGKLLHTGDSFEVLSTVPRIKAMNYDLHTGTLFGLAGKIMAFIAGLIAAALPVTGFLMWYWKRYC